MTDYARIPVSPDVKERLDDEKRDGESWSACMERLLQGDGETNKRLEEIGRQLDDLPERVASKVQNPSQPY